MFKNNEHYEHFDKLIILYLSENKPNSEGINIDFNFSDLNIADLASLVEVNCEEQDLLNLRDILKPNRLTHANIQQNINPIIREESEKEFLKRIEGGVII